MTVGVFAAGVYGGYFGAAQGVLLVGILSALMTISLQHINGLKNVLVTVVNAVAAVIFILVAPERINSPRRTSTALVPDGRALAPGRSPPTRLIRSVLNTLERVNDD
jgi:hypothetical protein